MCRIEGRACDEVVIRAGIDVQGMGLTPGSDCCMTAGNDEASGKEAPDEAPAPASSAPYCGKCTTGCAGGRAAGGLGGHGGAPLGNIAGDSNVEVSI